MDTRVPDPAGFAARSGPPVQIPERLSSDRVKPPPERSVMPILIAFLTHRPCTLGQYRHVRPVLATTPRVIRATRKYKALTPS